MASYAARLRAHVRIPLFWNSYLLMMAGVASAALGFAFWAVAARLFAPSAVGLSAAAVAALMFLTGVGGLFLDATLYRFLPGAGALRGPLVGWASTATIFSASAAAGVFLLGLDLWAPALSFADSSPWIVGACIGATVASCLLVLQDAALVGLGRAGWVPAKSVANGIAKIVLLVALAGLFPTYGILVAWALTTVLIAGAAGYLLTRTVVGAQREGSPVQPSLGARDVVGYAAGNYVGFLFMLGYRYLPPLLVIHEAGPRASAFFYPPWLVATSLLTLVSTNLSVALVVQGPDELAVSVRHAARQAARLTVPAAAVLLVSAPYALLIFGSAYAQEGANLLRLLALSLVPSSICVLSFGVARVQDHLRAVVLNQMALAVLMLTLSTVLLPPLGITGVGLAWLVAQTAVAIVLFRTQLWPALRRA